MARKSKTTSTETTQKKTPVKEQPTTPQAPELTPASTPQESEPTPVPKPTSVLDSIASSIIRIKAPRTGLLLEIHPDDAIVTTGTEKGVDVVTIEAKTVFKFVRTIKDARGTEHVTPGVF